MKNSYDWINDPEIYNNVIKDLELQFQNVGCSISPVFNIIGYGALMSKKTAHRIFPSLQNFKVVKIFGWKRVFAHPAIIYYERGIANTETKEVSDLSIEPSQDLDSPLFVCTFQVPTSCLKKYIESEDEFDYKVVPFYDLDGNLEGHGIACAGFSSDSEYIEKRLNGSYELFSEIWYLKWGIDRIWREDVLPCRIYLRHVILAAQKLAEEYNLAVILDNLLDFTFLGDRKTTIRAYLHHNDIMETKVPDHLLQYYSG
jgi:hypothetical protein